MKRFLAKVYLVFRKNWFSLVTFEVLYRLATTILLVKLANLFIDISLKRQNYSYLTAENYIKFIKNPYTLIFGLILLILMAFMTLVEVEAIFAYFRYGVRNQRLYAVEMIAKGIKNGSFFICEHKIAWGIYILGSIPFFCIHFLIREVSSIKFLEYTAIQVYKLIPSKGLLFLLGGIIFCVSTIIAFSLPYCVMEKKRIVVALKQSRKLILSRKGKNLIGIFGIQIGVMVATAMLYLVSAVIMVLVIMLLLSPSYRVSGVLYYGIWLKNALGALAGSFGIVLGIHYIGVFYITRVENAGTVLRDAGSGRRWFSKKKRKYIAIIGALALLFGEVGYLVYISKNYSSVSDLSANTPAVTAHRGGALITPENTMAAMHYSVESLSDYAEIDVQETKDHVVVLLHDTNLKRVTGLNTNIWNLNYQEVAQLDAGVKFNNRFLGEHIPTLEEVIAYSSGKIKLNIEIKANGHNDNIVSKVLKIIEKYNFEDQCFITSMNYKFLAQVKALNPKVVTGYIMTMAYGSVKNMDMADFVSVKNTYINRSFVEDAHASGKEVHAWTVNYPGDIKRMISCGVDNIITDNPALVHQVYLGDATQDTGFFDLLRYALK